MSKVIKRWLCNYIPDESIAIPSVSVRIADVASPSSPLIKSPPATVVIIVVAVSLEATATLRMRWFPESAIYKFPVERYDVRSRVTKRTKN